MILGDIGKAFSQAPDWVLTWGEGASKPRAIASTIGVSQTFSEQLIGEGGGGGIIIRDNAMFTARHC